MNVEIQSLRSLSAGERKSERSVTPAASVQSKGDKFEWVLFWAVICGLASLPLWPSRNDLMASAVNGIWFCGLAVSYEIGMLVKQRGHAVGLAQIWISASLFVAVVFWIVVQNATWAPEDWHHPIWAMTADALARPVPGSISVNRDLTTLSLIRLITAASAFWLAAQLCRDGARANRMMAAIAAIVVCYAGVGLVTSSASGPSNRAADSSSFLLLPSLYRDGHYYALYTGIGLVVVCALLLRLYRYDITTIGGSLRFRLASILEATGQKGAVLMGAAFLLLVALAFFASFSGVVTTALGLMVLMVVTLSPPRTNNVARGGIRLQWLLLAVLSIAAAAILPLVDPSVGRVEEEGVAGESRLAVAMIALRSIFNSPWFGYGFGTFADVFGMFRDRSISTEGFWNTAHNIYLEAFQGLGVVAGAMFIACVIVLVAKCLRGANERRQAAVIPGIATSVAFLVGVDGLVSSGLQIQSIALTFMTLLGAGVAQCKTSRLDVGD
jgi:O-antigen ligase